MSAVATPAVGDAAAIRPVRIDIPASDLELIARSFDGAPEGLTRDDVLDNATLFWLTNTAVSAARLYWENKLAVFSPKGVTVPVAVSAFPDALFQAPRSRAEQAYPKLIHDNRLSKRGTPRRLGAADAPQRGDSRRRHAVALVGVAKP